eukprot:Rmarinus@m.18959
MEHLLYRDPHSTYFMAENFQDFTKIDWRALGVDPARTVVFFDDHMDNLRRMQEAQERGFRYLIFDDNNNPVEGDSYTIRHMFEGTKEFVNSLNLTDYAERYRNNFDRMDNFGRVHNLISYEEHGANADKARALMKSYVVTPPLFWYSGLKGIYTYNSDQWLTISPEPLFKNLEQIYERGWNPVPFKGLPDIWELSYYYFMCLVELQPLN